MRAYIRERRAPVALAGIHHLCSYFGGMDARTSLRFSATHPHGPILTNIVDVSLPSKKSITEFGFMFSPSANNVIIKCRSEYKYREGLFSQPLCKLVRYDIWRDSALGLWSQIPAIGTLSEEFPFLSIRITRMQAGDLFIQRKILPPYARIYVQIARRCISCVFDHSSNLPIRDSVVRIHDGSDAQVVGDDKGSLRRSAYYGSVYTGYHNYERKNSIYGNPPRSAFSPVQAFVILIFITFVGGVVFFKKGLNRPDDVIIGIGLLLMLLASGAAMILFMGQGVPFL